MHLENIFANLKPIIFSAGDILLEYFEKKIDYVDKKKHVTKADLHVEEFLKKELKQKIGNSAFWAEESGMSGKGDYCWIIDPLDGTTNFVQSIPFFCISVALAYKNELILGVIYDPIAKELFFADKNGASLNDQKIKVSSKKQLSKSIISISLPAVWRKESIQNWQKIRLLRDKCYSTRIMCSAALELAYVASGRLDACFLGKLNWWDIAAGKVLVERAGGIITDHNNDKLTPEFGSLLAGNADIHKKIINLIK